jgi:hypothetical protein
MVLKLIDEYQQLGECNEAVNLRINAAQWANLAGDTAELSSWVDALDGAERCALTPAVRNRLALLRGRYAVVQGDLASAMKSYAAAVAAETNNVQRAQTRRALADVYRQLGMHGEALTQIAVALKELPASESPQRVALALMVLSAIQHDRADWQSAARWATEARAIFERHGQDHEAQLAQTAAAEAWLQSGDIEQAKRAFGAELSSDQRPQRCLLAAELQIAAKQPAAARRLLGSPGCRARTLDDQLRHAVLSTQVANETDSAQTSFLPIALQVQRLLSDSNVALRFAAVRRTRVLREALLARDDWNPDTIGDLILATHPYRSPSAAGASAPSVSSALGSLLLSAEAEPAATSAALGAQLGALGRQDGDAGAAPPSTDAVRAALADGQWLMMLALGQQRSAAVWVSGEQLLVRALPGQRQLLAAVDAIHEGLRLRDDERLDGAIAELSAMLFAEAPAFGAELLVLADERLSSIPLALLRPNGRDPLIATTAASWVSSFSTESRAAPAGDIGVVVASNLGPGASDKLAPLYSAEQEPSLLKAAVPDATIEVHAGLGATPSVLHRELMQSGRLVHVAAHGTARPQALGYAGLWLAPEKAGGDPQFLSWLDMAAQPLYASLAVLNACQMAAGSTHIGTPSFALAVSTAGVDNVIAASWPISDAASSVWVPVFYRALDRRRPDSSADALRQAQLALMKSRYFRHPYYWASLAHFRQLQIAAPPRE